MEGDPLLDSLCNEPRVQGDCAGIKVSRLSGKVDFRRERMSGPGLAILMP
jgi:hypothetical protein